MQNTNISVSVAAHINELDGSNQVMQTAGMFCQGINVNLVIEFSTLGIEMGGETKKRKNASTNTACALRKQDGAFNGMSMQ